MEIRLLGPLEVRTRGRAVDVAGRRLRLLLAVLALQPGQVVPAERLIDLLWEGASPPADPANALQALVSRLRRALEAAGSGEWLVSRPSGYLLAVEPDQVDALRFERLCRDGHGALAAGRHLQAAATLREALDLWRGPPLALYAAGRQADALAAYQRVRRALAERAGLDPGLELRRVEEAILAQDPSLTLSAAPVASEPASPARRGRSNLRGPLTSFVGREEELARILELLGRHRLLTLTGPGGVGKTRLAVEAARRLGHGLDGGRQADGDAPDTVWLVELAGLVDGRLVALSVLGTLGLG